jgi:hypothetical protein
MSIRYLHVRKENLQKGGTTVAYEVDDDTIRFAVAKCSDRDNYCRKTGRSIATGRLNANKDRTIAYMRGAPIEAILRNL